MTYKVTCSGTPLNSVKHISYWSNRHVDTYITQNEIHLSSNITILLHYFSRIMCTHRYEAIYRR